VIILGASVGKGAVNEDFCTWSGVPGQQGRRFETWIGDDSVFRSHTVVYAGNRIGACFQTGYKVNIREQNEIGDNVSIGTLSIVEHHVRIGNGVRIHSQVFIPEFSVIEDDAWIGPNVVFTHRPYPSLRGQNS
jgi:UDP-3-O-[3-hydroxymyristoyl] glucosamine N-acyltransferase